MGNVLELEALLDRGARRRADNNSGDGDGDDDDVAIPPAGANAGGGLPVDTNFGEEPAAGGGDGGLAAAVEPGVEAAAVDNRIDDGLTAVVEPGAGVPGPETAAANIHNDGELEVAVEPGAVEPGAGVPGPGVAAADNRDDGWALLADNNTEGGGQHVGGAAAAGRGGAGVGAAAPDAENVQVDPAAAAAAAAVASPVGGAAEAGGGGERAKAAAPDAENMQVNPAAAPAAATAPAAQAANVEFIADDNGEGVQANLAAAATATTTPFAEPAAGAADVGFVADDNRGDVQAGPAVAAAAATVAAPAAGAATHDNRADALRNPAAAAAAAATAAAVIITVNDNMQPNSTTATATAPTVAAAFASNRDPAQPRDDKYKNQALTFLKAEFPLISWDAIRYGFRHFEYDFTRTYEFLAGVQHQIDAIGGDAEVANQSIDLPFEHRASFVVALKNPRKPPSKHKLRTRHDDLREEMAAIPGLNRKPQASTNAAVGDGATGATSPSAASQRGRSGKGAGDDMTCQCCFADDVNFASMVQCTEGCLFCQNCVASYLQEELFGKNRMTFPCMDGSGCSGQFLESDFDRVFSPNTKQKVDDYGFRLQFNKLTCKDSCSDWWCVSLCYSKMYY